MIVNYKLKNVLNVGPFRLAPGMNHGINESVFNDCVGKYPRLRDLIDSGDVVVVEKRKPKDDVTESGGAEQGEFASLDPKDAIDIVKQTPDLSVLEELLAGEKRADVKKAIRAQIKKVKAAHKAAEKQNQADDGASEGAGA